MIEKVRPKSPRFTRYILYLVLAAFYLPVLVVICQSFIEHGEDGSVLTLKWYASVFEDPKLFEALQRSLSVGLASALISTVLGTCAALVLVRMPFLGRRFLDMLSQISLMLPELVFALSLLSWFSLLGLDLGLHTVVISHVTFSISFVLLTVAARVKTLDRRLDDAAYDLGAGEWQTLFYVTLPLIFPAMVAGFILALLLSFDDFLITFYTNGPGADTLPVVLYSQMKYGLSPKLHALASMMLMGSVTLILSLKKYYERL